jgi:hypothetical protein
MKEVKPKGGLNKQGAFPVASVIIIVHPTDGAWWAYAVKAGWGVEGNRLVVVIYDNRRWCELRGTQEGKSNYYWLLENES